MGKESGKVFILLFLVFIQSTTISGQHGRPTIKPINNALYLGTPEVFNTTFDDCIWKRLDETKEKCTDEDVAIIMYTSGENVYKTLFDPDEADWLLRSKFDPSKENIVLVHGYAGGDDTLPIVVLRDAYLKHGGYNVFMVDWGKVTKPPCYMAAVHNLRSTAHCVANHLTNLRLQGLNVEKTTCVGHSLGAHICGLLANYLTFRLEKIIALDPARPLIKPGNQNRLDAGDAKFVQVIHTNAGFYGEAGKIGHVDFCVNGGRRQPYCENTTNINLCSHIWSVCYLSQSIFEDMDPMAEPCSRRCPTAISLNGIRSRSGKARKGFAINYAVPMGHKTPIATTGSYCLRDNEPPFCPKTTDSIGDKRCCMTTPEYGDLI